METKACDRCVKTIDVCFCASSIHVSASVIIFIREISGFKISPSYLRQHIEVAKLLFSKSLLNFLFFFSVLIYHSSLCSVVLYSIDCKKKSWASLKF